MGPDEVADVGDDPSNDVRLTVCVVEEVRRGEATAEHVGLELQARVEQPEQSQDDLKYALCSHEPEVPASVYDR